MILEEKVQFYSTLLYLDKVFIHGDIQVDRSTLQKYYVLKRALVLSKILEQKTGKYKTIIRTLEDKLEKLKTCPQLCA